MVDTNNLSILSRLRSLTNVGAAPTRRALDVMSGDEAYAPTEGELLQQQLASISEGGGTYETPSGYTGNISREALRESGVQQFKRKLRSLNEQYVVPKQIEGVAGLQRQSMTNAGNLAVEQLKGQNASATAAVPRTVNTNVTTNAGGGQGNTAQAYSEQRTARALDQIQYLLPKVNSMTAGYGALLKYFPTTRSKEFAGELEALKSQISSNELIEMRNASKTGGALGNVSDRDIALLQSAYGALDQSNSPEVLKHQLERIGTALQDWEIKKRQLGYNGVGGTGQGIGEFTNLGTATGSGTTAVDPYGLGF